MTTAIADTRVTELLDRLYAQDAGQTGQLAEYFQRRVSEGSLNWNELDEDAHRFLSDKLVALERDKAEFCYRLCRALRARRAVEAGTSHGISTLHLAAALRANALEDGGPAVVIGTECEPSKAAVARMNFTAAGLADVVELRVGDLRETLRNVEGPIDFMLLDIWTQLARPALELIAPRLRAGAIVIADNTTQFRSSYADYFAFIEDPANRFSTMTLPFKGGLEFTVRL
jgi:predicted O-methyltransferase YrrM